MSPNPSKPVHPLKRLLKYGRRYRLKTWLASICSLLNKFFDLAPPALIGIAVDVVVKQQDSILAKWGIKDVVWQLAIITFLSLIVWTLESVFEYAYDYLWRNLAQDIEHDLRLEAYSHLQELELAYFEERSTGGLISILNDDINQLERFLDGGANEVIQVSTTVIVISAAFFAASPAVAILSMLPIPFIIWGSFAFQNRLAPLYADVREKVSFLNGQLSNNLTGITTIKSFTSEDYETQRIETQSQAYRQSNRRAIAISAAFIPLIRVVIFLGFIATLFLGGLEVVAGRLSVGTYSVLVFLTQRLLWPLTRLGDTMDRYQRAMASTNRVMNLLDTPIAIRTGDIRLPVSSIKGTLEFKNVTFYYNQRKPILQYFSLTLPAGKTTAIVGATGSGKSTLVKLIMRLYEVQYGQIYLDGIELTTLNLKDLRRAIGLVSQDVFLFHGTVAQNIAYGTFDATDREIVNAAQIAEADEFIAQLPDGYNTIVGERGQKLSGGQRQRIAIARAVLKNPPILILDEATSAVDNETEAAIQRSLERITKNRTTIAIAHRLSTVRNADCIFVMEQGRVVESGHHEQLIEHNGVYASLWRVQSGIK
ncbi:MAG: ABC transporter ATP-binding protein [Microcoleus sp. PH2017_29_MFU_D_A]|uniref:ABC transporter ATP-binding protein n=1 Tax=unclassified Microcoleus TaxID=2642155 RepID=UPI001D8688C3|nr:MULTISPECIES: ABC transporter ATP-binding protein [unclassified Microcoleus]MCC3510425.1 ABC transporter ATP-binding protein [Microcoleus sp. PH2017_17_BER_D_A]MCC3412868.1 ABC transporter ATP-binding protein [Microcoleus sp. PH2017_02_FOX_O_A]MCC3426938.1 ABC transporter ATP-binding protein [Microcoleus sp. PH2017_01_SCD_O_A]MCC3493533.1 ABC transporter ATP-binding protein [Microcoleus sp. PH2017_16_JOR_D_A]MCC3536564.1 ABC transporter ATP-binding protein [Microcoleus sp. PH2017_25_DOB_D_A